MVNVEDAIPAFKKAKVRLPYVVSWQAVAL
jgi:hypothetical protein